MISPRQELLALGAANLAVAFGQGMPVAGGLSQSAVNDKAGAKTLLALLFASVTLAACLLFLTDILGNLRPSCWPPSSSSPSEGDRPVRCGALRQVSRFEFRISIVALVAVLLPGILKGMLFAAVASLLMLLAGAARPHVAFLGRIHNEAVPGVVIFRASPRCSTSMPNMFDRSCGTSFRRPQGFGWSSATCPMRGSLISPARNMLAGLHRDLTRAKSGSASSRPMRKCARCRAVGLEERVGYVGRHTTVDQVIVESQAAVTP